MSIAATTTLGERLAAAVREGDLWDRLDDRRIRCFACGHFCPIFEGQPGVCKVRYNRGGKLYVPWGYVESVQCDPIEKKPFFHVRPGARTCSFGMLGCDLHCGYCQNWVTSQALRDPAAGVSWQRMTPERLVETARRYGADVMVSTYNEPLITAEWAREIFRCARASGMITAFVSNGNATPEVLQYMRPWLDLFKVDLKSFNDRHYRELGGRLQPVLDSLRRIYDMGFWLEVVTLVVPGFNDSDDELQSIAGYLAGISRDIPWHVTAFHPDYRMSSTATTPRETLIRAAAVGRSAGLRYVYAGNLGGIGDLENTVCPSLAARSWLSVKATGLCEMRCTQPEDVQDAEPAFRDGGRSSAMALMALVTLLAAAGMFKVNGDAGPRYERTTEIGVIGILQETREIPESQELSGVHLLVRNEKDRGIVDVYVAPGRFLRDLGIIFNRGTEVTVKGSKVKVAGVDLVLARDIRWDSSKVLTLRYPDGRPFW